MSRIVETLSFCINTCLRGHEEYETDFNQSDKHNLSTDLCDIYEEMRPKNFGRLMTYLTLVYKIADSYEEEIVREAVQICIFYLRAHVETMTRTS